MFKHFKTPSAVAAGIALAFAAGTVQAEQTIGVQATAAAAATARVNVKVVVPKIVILRVGTADTNQSDVTFTVGLTPAVSGDSQAYSGGIPPSFATSTAVTNAGGASGVGEVSTALWTNVGPVGSNSTKLTCALSDIATYTPLASGNTTAGGVPGTTSIAVAGDTALAHPGSTLTDCNGSLASTTTIAALTPISGKFTYTANFPSTGLLAGSYGKQVTYTATTP